jgi:hypothetical protein
MMRREVGSAGLAALTLFLSAAGRPAVSQPSAEGWSELRTENFVIVSQVDEGATRAIGAELEKLRFALERIFERASFDSPLQTYLFVFRDAASFAPYSLGAGEPGYFVPHIHANFAAVAGGAHAAAMPVVYC